MRPKTTLLGLAVGGALLAVAALNVVVFGASASALVLGLAAVFIMYGDRYVLRPALSREADAIVCRYAPWNEVGISLAFALMVVLTLFCLTSRPRFGPGFIYGVILAVLSVVAAAKFLRGHRRCLLTITPTSLGVSLPERSYAVNSIARERVRSIEPTIETIVAKGTRDVLLTRITYSGSDSEAHATGTVCLGPAPATDTVWLSVKPSHLLAALQFWKEGDPTDSALLDRVEAILRGREAAEHTAADSTASPFRPPGDDDGQERMGQQVSDGFVAQPAAVRAGLPWWSKTLVVAIGIVLGVGWVNENAAVARLQPPRDAWFADGTATVSVTAAEPRTVYWDVWSEPGRHTVHASAQCRAVDAESGSEIPLETVRGDLRVGNVVALATMHPTRTGKVELTCSSTRTIKSAFALGAEVPAPRFLNGVSNYSGDRTGPMLFALAVLVPALIIFSLVSVKPIVRVWVFRFWAPLLIAALLVFPMSSIWNGFLFWLLWFGIGSLYWKRKKNRNADSADTTGEAAR